MENNNRQGCRWVKVSEREPSIGDYYYCKVDTKQDCIVKTVVEWGKHKNGEFEYDDWDLDNVAHFGDFGEDAEVIEWLDESIEPCATSSEKGEPYYGKEYGNAFERLVHWATHGGWRYCQGDEVKCGNEPILKLSHFNGVVKNILKQTAIEPCATSSENYWKQRCEAAEDYTYFAINNIYCEERESCYLKWKELKSTPMPIPTGDRDCEELPLDNDQPFNTKTVLETLIWASEHLLHEKNYDGGSVKGIAYEEIERCVVRAKELIKGLSARKDCEELKKEVERLKGLIKEGFVLLQKQWKKTPDQIKIDWKIFEAENL